MLVKAQRLVAGSAIAGVTLLSGVAGSPVSADVITSGCGAAEHTCVVVGGDASDAFRTIDIVIPINIVVPACDGPASISDSGISGGDTCVRVAGR